MDTNLNDNENENMATAKNFGSHSNFKALPEITVDAPSPSDDEGEQEVEELYDDGSTVKTTILESNIYAEAVNIPRTTKSDSEPLYNNIPGDNTSQGSYYMQLITATASQDDQYDTPSLRRQPKDHTEMWEPPHL